MPENQFVVFFDGVCNLCNDTVQFIIKRDPKNKFSFATLQSEKGQQTLVKLKFDTQSFDTFILLKKGKLYLKSTAACLLFKELSGLWPILYLFIIIPRPIRDCVYSVIAKNRYKWFGKKDHCMIPTPELKKRFI